MNIRKILLVLGFVVGGLGSLCAQETIWPLDIKISQSSSFAEFRGTRFHAGIDLRTKRTTGFPVIAIADGFISRMKVQFRGYGYALYIDHPHLKKRVVYGHLEDFASPMADYASKKLARIGKRHGINDFFKANKFPVRKGQIVGYSGESGSGPPHLHFEIRTLNDHPVAPALLGYRPKDNIFPKFYHLYIMPLDYAVSVDGQLERKSIRLKKIKGHNYTWKNPIVVSGPVGLKIGVMDFNGGGNVFGIESLELKANNNTVLKKVFHEYSYPENGQCSLIYDYYLCKSRGKGYVYNLIKWPHEKIPFAANYKAWAGMLSSAGSSVKNIKIIAKDFGGNTITATGKIKFVPPVRKKLSAELVNSSFDFNAVSQTLFSLLANGKKKKGQKNQISAGSYVVSAKDGNGKAFDLPCVVRGKRIQVAFPKNENWGRGAFLDKTRILPDSYLVTKAGKKIANNGEASVRFPKKSFYFPTFCSFTKASTAPKAGGNKKRGYLKPYSALWQLKAGNDIFDSSAELTIRPVNYHSQNLKQLGIYLLGRKGKYSHLGEKLVNGKLVASTRKPGKYVILEDKIPPAVWYKQKKKLKHLGRVYAFGIRDLGEGVNYLAAKAKVAGIKAETYADPDKAEIYVVNKTKSKKKIVLTVFDYAGNTKTITVNK